VPIRISSSVQYVTRGLTLIFVGAPTELTSEEVTARRRAERKQFKLDRAAAIAAVAEEAEKLFQEEGKVIVPALSGPAIPSAATWKPPSSPLPQEPVTPTEASPKGDVGEEPLENVEHMQLTLQEAFFLLWNLDCLTVLHPNTVRAALGIANVTYNSS
jgi:tRNA-splicing endonuclease subunit Sen2